MSELHDRIAGLSPVKRLLLEKLRMANARPPSAAIPRRDGGPAHLSWEQRRLWFLHRLAPGSSAYTIPLVFRLTGAFDPDTLAASLRTLVARHEALRLAFREIDGEPVQEAGPAERVPIDRIDLRDSPDAADARIAGFFARGFDLMRDPPLRVLLAQTARDEHLLAMALHHAASDGASSAVLLRELSALYAAACEGRDSHLPDPPLQLPDYAAWQRSREEDADALVWWRKALRAAPHVLEVPPDHPRPALQMFTGSRVAFTLSAEASRAVHARAAAEQATLFSVLAAALAVVLHRATGETDLLIGTAVANREAPGAHDAVGFFAGTVLLRISVDPQVPVCELVARTRRVVADAQDHARVPFDRIVEAVGVRRDPSRPPLVQVMLSLDPAEEEALTLPGIGVHRFSADTGASPFDLTVALADAPGGIRGEIQYRTDLFEAATVERLAARLTATLAAIARDSGIRVGELARVTEDERRALEGWSRGGEGSAGGSIHALIESQARTTPDATAIAWADQEVAYAELDRRANRVAHHLRRHGVNAEERVGVLMERTPALVAALVGVLKAGAAYVPLDPRNPPARLEAMLRASGAATLLVDRAHRGRLTGVLEIPIESVPAAAGTEVAPGIDVDPAQLACVIFTSGSTGVPKGVEIAHFSLCTLLHWVRELLPPEERTAVLASSYLGFDVAIVEVFGPLCWGGTTVLVDDVLSPAPRPVRTACIVPSVAAELLRAQRFPSGVRTLLLGGEALSPHLTEQIHRHLPGVRILNLYGPAECTVYATWEEVPPAAERIGIGRPTDGTRACVLDASLLPCGIGEPGELWLGGRGVARGYAGRPGLTAERFRPDPQGPPGARMYRTLDRVRYRNDGTLEYLGRGDAQLKLHGVRIEPGEVEAALRAHPALTEAAVAVHGDADARRLVAWLVAADGRPPPPSELRFFLRERLPEAMIPTAFVPMDALPRTASGKLDRRALPGPPPAEGDEATPVPPRDATEAAIAEAWCAVLGVSMAGVHNDFFQAGGNSLMALRLLSRVREALDVALSVATLLQGPTIAQLARAATERTLDVRLPVVPLQRAGRANPLFLVHAGGGHLLCYHPLARLMAPDQPLYGLQAQGLDDGLPPLHGAEAMAAHYLEGVRRVRPAGPYRLGGWSYGGMVAWEMARTLHAAGEQVELLALIDTQAPDRRDQPGLALDHAAVLRRVLTDLFGWAGTGSLTVEALRALDPEAQLALVVKRLGPRTCPAQRLPEIAALARVRMANHNAMVDFHGRPYPGRVTYFRSRGSARFTTAEETVRYWGRLAGGGFGLHEVDGNHGTLLQLPHVHSLAAALRTVLASV